jgi:hypothetical protein
MEAARSERVSAGRRGDRDGNAAHSARTGGRCAIRSLSGACRVGVRASVLCEIAASYLRWELLRCLVVYFCGGTVAEQRDRVQRRLLSIVGPAGRYDLAVIAYQIKMIFTG